MSETDDLIVYMLLVAVALAYGEYRHRQQGTLTFLLAGLLWTVVVGLLLTLIWG